MRSERIASAVGLVAREWGSLVASIHPFRRTEAVPCRIDEESGARWRNRTPVAAVQRASPATDGIGQNGATRRNQTSVSALRRACSVTELWRRKLTNGRRVRSASFKGGGRTSAVQFWTFTMPNISGGMEFWALRPPAEPAEGRPCAVLNWIPLFGCRHAHRDPIRPPRLRADG